MEKNQCVLMNYEENVIIVWWIENSMFATVILIHISIKTYDTSEKNPSACFTTRPYHQRPNLHPLTKPFPFC
jgi:hypothetical protein